MSFLWWSVCENRRVDIISRLTTAVVLLDLSSAFDTVDHSTLLTVLDRRFGVRESVMDWFSSYLSDRTQAMVWCQDRYQSPAASRNAPCWAQCSSFHIQKTSRWFSTVIKSIIIYMLITSRLMWAYLSIMCHWRVKHVNVVSVTSPRGAHHIDCSSTPLKQNQYSLALTKCWRNALTLIWRWILAPRWSVLWSPFVILGFILTVSWRWRPTSQK